MSEAENLSIQNGILAHLLAEIANGKRQLIPTDPDSAVEDDLTLSLRANLTRSLAIKTPNGQLSPDAILGILNRSLKEDFLSKHNLDLGALNSLLAQITKVRPL